MDDFMGTIFSIGHGNKEVDQLLFELKSFNVQFLLDVRSSPYSKWNPQYNREAIELVLKTSGIKYAFFGDSLGGRPNDSSCYDENGRVLYDKISEKKFFKDGVLRLMTAVQQGHDVAMMCSESNPAECHRSKLIGQYLLKYNVSVQHIINSLLVKPQEMVAGELTGGRNVENLFGELESFTSRKTY